MHIPLLAPARRPASNAVEALWTSSADAASMLTSRVRADLIVDVSTDSAADTGSTTHELGGLTYLVTGASSGIGRATALDLGRRGGRVLLACRSVGPTGEVVDEIDAAPGPGRAEHLPLDLADLESVRACAQAVLDRGDPIDVLVNNAGLAGHAGVTAQGFERTFGINHLGHFLLTTMLLDHLRSGGAGAGGARIVNLSSNAHYGAKRIDFDAQLRPTKTFAGLGEYQVSKLCNVLFTQELARRVPASEVASFAVHPGVVASNIWQKVPWPIRPIALRFMTSVEDGATTSLHCATAPGLEIHSGSYFEKSRLREASDAATPELAAELWSRSLAWTT